MFQISEYEVDSFITIIQVKLRCCLCCLISLTFVAEVGGGGGVGGGASCPGQFILPPTWVLCLIFLMLISLVLNFLYMKLNHL